MHTQSFPDLAVFALRPAPVRDQSPRRLLASCHTRRAAPARASARRPGEEFRHQLAEQTKPAAITPPHKSIRTLRAVEFLCFGFTSTASPCHRGAALHQNCCWAWKSHLLLSFPSQMSCLFHFREVQLSVHDDRIVLFLYIFALVCFAPCDPRIMFSCLCNFLSFCNATETSRHEALSLGSMKTLNLLCATDQLFVTFFL